MHVPPEDVHGHLVRPILAGAYHPDMLVPVYQRLRSYTGEQHAVESYLGFYEITVTWITYAEACAVTGYVAAFDKVCSDPMLQIQLITLYLRGTV